MLFSHFIRLCFVSSTLIAATPTTTLSYVPTSLPEALQQSIPTCAESCLQKSLADNFPIACTAQDDIECLCSRYSYSGESLGEIAFSCVYEHCASNKESELSAYNVCLGQKNAVLPTKTAFTIVVGSTSSTKTTSSTTTRLSSTSAATATTTSMTATTFRTQISSSSQSIFIDSISSTPPATSAPSGTLAPTAFTVEDSRRLTPAQIAGLSVAAVASFVFAIGLMALSVCLRRRRERNYQQLSDEKSQGRREKKKSARFSHYVPLENLPEPPKQAPLPLPPAVRTTDENARSGRTLPNNRPADWTSIRPVQRLGVGTLVNTSDASLPLDQIGLAISAEQDGKPVAPQPPKAAAKQQRPKSIEAQRDAPFRPFSTMTQNTVFEEDEIVTHNRSSVLPSTPPVPIPPIRKLQPSRSASKPNADSTVSQLNKNGSRKPRGSELFLDIPDRHKRPQLRRIAVGINSSSSSSSPAPRSTPQTRLAPPIHTTSSSTIQSKSTSASTSVSGNGGDILDYYLSPHSSPAPSASPAQVIRPKVSLRTIQIKPKKSISTASSHTSITLRDSISSQTSFETADPDDSTPEDEEEKQLSSDDNKLSPVVEMEMESPISKLRYPKVPRASNQYVPRSPKSGGNTRSPRGIPDQSSLAAKRRGEKPGLQLGTAFTSPSSQHKHIRSTSETTTTPSSPYNRSTRTQSALWPSSPIMYEPTVVQPLNVRRGVFDPEKGGLNIERWEPHDEELKSPAWIPRLTPTRKGDDLMISVGWGR